MSVKSVDEPFCRVCRVPHFSHPCEKWEAPTFNHAFMHHFHRAWRLGNF